MASVLKLRRGTSSQNDSFTGANGEITYDVTNKTIRAHDGLTAGGVKLAKNSDVTTKMSVANTQALFATVSANNATINKKMSVANTQTLHTSVTANLNSYIANTNPRITNVLTSISGTNTAIRSLVSDESSRVNLVNTNLTGTNTAIRTLVSDRMQVANVASRFTTSDASISTKMSVANTQTLHASVTANLNSYVANTNPRITNVLSSIASTNTALRTYTDDSIAALANSAPVTLNTLNELAAALGDDANFATTLTTNLGQKLGSAASVTLTGAVTGTASFSSNAVSITTTATADPTITLGGDLTGNVTLTNLGNGTLTATVVDDSHNHVISNVDGLQTDLDTRATWSGLTGTNTAIRSLVSDESSRVNLVNTNLTNTNTAIRTLVSDRMQVANTIALANARLGKSSTVTLTGDITASATAFSANAVSVATTLSNSGVSAGTYGNSSAIGVVTIDAKGRVTAATTAAVAGVTSVNYYGANATLRIATADGTNFDTGISTNDKMTVANTQALHTSITANLNSYIANTNPRLTAIQSDIDSNEVMERSALANTNAYIASVQSDVDTNEATERSALANTNAYIATKADLASPTLTGVPSAPTAANTTSTTQIATTAFVQNVVDIDIAALANSAPVTLNTLNELAAALGDDANFATTLTTNLGQKLGAGASVALTGDVSGTANFSSNAVSITTVIADDSHNHVISNVDGLQTALDAKATLSQLTGTNTAIRTLVSDRMQVANVTSRFVTSDASIADKMSVANTQALFASVSANNSTINTKMSVANTQALHTSVTANLNSYIANTNPRLTAIQSDIDSNEVMERAALANTNVYISNTLAKAQTLANARLGKTATVTLTGDITASASAFSANAVSVATTLSNSGVSAGTYGNSSAIGVVTIDAKGRVTGATTADVAGVTSVNYYGANATLRIATADGTNFDTGISTNDKMTVANTQALHTSVTANLNSYIANTNPRITNILSSVSSTNTALRTYTDDSIAALANSAPVTLNTLNELAAALGDDANFATTLTTNLGQKLGSSASVTLTGDVSGTANFSANAVTITATVADDSHNHIIGNVDGLQTELDTKSTWSGLTTTNTAIRSLVSDRMQVANTTLLVNDRMQVANVTSLLAGKIDKVGGIVINNRTVISSDGLLDTTQLGGGFSDSSLYIFPTGSLDGDDTYVGETRVRKDPFGVTTINIYDCMEPVGHYKATDLGSL